MSAIIDEGVPVRLVKALGELGCPVQRFPRGWKGLQNGRLIDRIRGQGLSCLITCDKNLSYQQNITQTGLALVVLPRQRFEDLGPFLREIAEAVGRAQPGDLIVVGENQTVRGR
ncbi:hypothetical protein PZ895_15180 [Mesorhizobium sp. YIM 152430]|uniref:hypothetical protein n=1 Tax=Mesorhizobium sp. YIM 152430 TaxID=3031761 RepID=UPI0023DAB579|nr:hypothetical protein [Mesorhizobium sp. YIM 152430]MDF1601103.1 hypothetical protein [Mesorhizobium sp. YIM 152430]